MVSAGSFRVPAEASNSAPKKMSSRPTTSASFTSAGSWLKARCQSRALSAGGRNSGGEGVMPGSGASETIKRATRSGWSAARAYAIGMPVSVP
jgi:hypothetical protein